MSPGTTPPTGSLIAARRIEVAGDQDLWSLLHGYGPEPYSRPGRTMDDFQRWCFIRDRLLAATEGVHASSDVRLVLEVRG